MRTYIWLVVGLVSHVVEDGCIVDWTWIVESILSEGEMLRRKQVLILTDAMRVEQYHVSEGDAEVL